MKAAGFGVVRAESLAEVLDALAEHGDEARVIAGGQSLAPMMALRLASPTVLVDLSRVPGLHAVDAATSGLRLGAMVRQRTVERDAAVAAAAPLVAEALPHIAHAAIRSQGTVCGSLAHADPAAELPAVALAAGATMHLRSAIGTRAVAVADFFTGYYSTAVAPTEILEAVTFPASAPRTGTAFVEFSRRHGDFALVGAAATVSLAADGTIAAASLALSGVASTPWLGSTAASLLIGAPAGSGRIGGSPSPVGVSGLRPVSGEAGAGRTAGSPSPVDGSGLRPEVRETVRAAGEAVRAAVDPNGDLHASAAYRRHLAGVLTTRALTTAIARAQEAAG